MSSLCHYGLQNKIYLKVSHFTDGLTQKTFFGEIFDICLNIKSKVQIYLFKEMRSEFVFQLNDKHFIFG
jgi:hypothetical protein